MDDDNDTEDDTKKEDEDMAGIEIQVVRRTPITLPVISTGTYKYPPLVQFIDTLGWVSGVLLVRVYATSAPSITIGAYNQMVSADDPAVTFDETTDIASVNFAGNAAAPALYTAKIPTNSANAIGRLIGVRMQVVASGALSGSITIGVDLIGRDA
jgi:hypothetical protein